jgi:hypothetical protein
VSPPPREPAAPPVPRTGGRAVDVWGGDPYTEWGKPVGSVDPTGYR